MEQVSYTQKVLGGLRRALYQMRTHYRLAKHRAFARTQPLKLNIGGGYTSYDGWITTTLHSLDITKDAHWRRYFHKDSIDNVLAEHVLEHLTPEQCRTALTNVFRYLKPGGVFRIAVPDGYHPSKYVIDLIKPGGLDEGSDDHKVLYTIDLLTKAAHDVGFTAHPIEYFDSSGIFHAVDTTAENGYIQRSAANYRGRFTDSAEEMAQMLASTPEPLRAQFKDKGISYTSLLIDLIK